MGWVVILEGFGAHGLRVLGMYLEALKGVWRCFRRVGHRAGVVKGSGYQGGEGLCFEVRFVVSF